MISRVLLLVVAARAPIGHEHVETWHHVAALIAADRFVRAIV
jgi:hypothetical protein